MKIILLLLLSVSCATNNQSTDWDKYYQDKNDEFTSMLYPENYVEISQRVTKIEYVSGFKEQFCKKLKHEKCVEAFRVSIKEQMLNKYNLSREEDFRANCAQYPQACDNPEFMELAYIKSHNFYVNVAREAWLEKERSQINQMLDTSARIAPSRIVCTRINHNQTECIQSSY